MELILTVSNSVFSVVDALQCVPVYVGSAWTLRGLLRVLVGYLVGSWLVYCKYVMRQAATRLRWNGI